MTPNAPERRPQPHTMKAFTAPKPPTGQPNGIGA
jgi:hypothetical protein